MKVKSRLAVLVSIPAVIALTLGLGIHQSMDGLSRSTQSVIKERLEPALLLSEINNLYSRKIIDLAHKTKAQMLFWGEADAELKEAKLALNKLWSDYRSLNLSEAEQKVLSDNVSAFSESDKVIQSLESFIQEQSSYSMGSFVDLELYAGIEPIIQTIHQLSQLQKSLAQQTAVETQKDLQQHEFQLIALAIVMVVFCLVLGLWIMKSLQVDLKAMLTVITKIERSKDLTVRSDIRKKNEFGDMSRRFDRMIGVFSDLIQNTQHSASEVKASAQSLVKVNHDNQNQSEQQIEALKQTESAMDQLQTAATTVLDNVDSTNQATTEVQEVATEGSRAVKATVGSIVQVSNIVKETAVSMETLKGHSQEIGAVVETIKGIAEQINLLALNAAIEAARAGEYGRGFAVVADEVRQLAFRTANSTQEIQDSIEQIQASTDASWNLMQQGKDATAEAVVLAEASGDKIDIINHQFSAVVERNFDIRKAVEIQHSTVDQVKKSLEELKGLALEGEALSIAGFNTAENLDGIVKQVSSQIDTFKVTPSYSIQGQGSNSGGKAGFSAQAIPA